VDAAEKRISMESIQKSVLRRGKCTKCSRAKVGLSYNNGDLVFQNNEGLHEVILHVDKGAVLREPARASDGEGENKMMDFK